MVNKEKKELVDDLMKTDIGTMEGRNVLHKKLVRELRKSAETLGINTQKMKTHKKRAGWANNGKGLLQVLWERGHIDETKLSEYKKEVVDEDGNIVPEFSLVHLMATAPDFVNETSQIEHVCIELGKRAGVKIKAMISTKYYAEYAGEGIEYAWAFSKSLYRR